jgi:predicted DNA-binding WGR domain protein
LVNAEEQYKPDHFMPDLKDRETIETQRTGAKPRYFEFAEGNSGKFRKLPQVGNTMTTRWSRIGPAGQSKTHTFADESATAQATADFIEDKTGEGHVECSR